jgi:hypothetical protein
VYTISFCCYTFAIKSHNKGNNVKEFIKVYNENQEDIEKFIITTLKNNGSILAETSSNYKKVFQTMILLVYLHQK